METTCIKFIRIGNKFAIFDEASEKTVGQTPDENSKSTGRALYPTGIGERSYM